MDIPMNLSDLSHRWLYHVTLFSLVGLIIGFTRLISRPSLRKNFPPSTTGNFPIIGDMGFFTRRWTWWRKCVSASPSGNFSYHIGKYLAVGVSGESGRKFFFESRDLNFAAGYAVLFGQAPANPSVSGAEDYDKWFSVRLLEMLKNHNLQKILPQIVSDTHRITSSIIETKSASPSLPTTTTLVDPFDVIYELVFLINMRTVGCQDIADSPTLLQKVLGYYQTIEDSTTPTGIMFPWIPTLSKIRRTYAAAKLYTIFDTIVKDRKRSKAMVDDPLSLLLSKGDEMSKVIEFIIGALFAAQLNSGMNAAWILSYLGHSKHWQDRVLDEIRVTVAKYSMDSSLPLVDQLRFVPIEVWETGFQILDACVRDSIRLQLLGTSLRRNVSGKDLTIGGEVVPSGAFVIYHLGDTHQDPNIFPDPEKWDPARHLNEDAKYRSIPHGFLGWGSGRHPCLGMRFAKLEMSVVLAHFVAIYAFETVEESGNSMKELPKVNHEGHAASKPTRPMWLRVTRR